MDNQLRNNLKYLRKKNATNQDTLGLQVNKKATTIGNWENGLSEPNITEILIISKYFGVSVDELLTIDLSKGNLTTKTKDSKKGNVKGNPLGNLNAGNDTKKATGVDAGSLKKLIELQEEQLNINSAINTELIGILSTISGH